MSLRENVKAEGLDRPCRRPISAKMLQHRLDIAVGVDNVLVARPGFDFNHQTRACDAYGALVFSVGAGLYCSNPVLALLASSQNSLDQPLFRADGGIALFAYPASAFLQVGKITVHDANNAQNGAMRGEVFFSAAVVTPMVSCVVEFHPSMAALETTESLFDHVIAAPWLAVLGTKEALGTCLGELDRRAPFLAAHVRRFIESPPQHLWSREHLRILHEAVFSTLNDLALPVAEEEEEVAAVLAVLAEDDNMMLIA